ncbi:MAG TPA: polyhydroxyalkanoic acid system family protein [Methylovirgula sp.]|jgi:hypothetical protein
MTKSIVLTVPHALTQDEAKRRISAELDQLKGAYIDKFAQSTVTWTGYTAQIRVVALMQQATANIDIGTNTVRVEIVLPWILASIANVVQEKLSASAEKTLALPPSSKKS